MPEQQHDITNLAAEAIQQHIAFAQSDETIQAIVTDELTAFNAYDDSLKRAMYERALYLAFGAALQGAVNDPCIVAEVLRNHRG